MSTATATAAGIRLTQMPKVDLLPPEIAAEATFRKLRLGLGLGVAAAVGVVGLSLVTPSMWRDAAGVVGQAARSEPPRPGQLDTNGPKASTRSCAGRA